MVNVSIHERRTADEQSSRPVASWAWTLPICALVTYASVLGLVDHSVYRKETLNWATQGRGQDLGNLIAVVTLMLSAYRYQRGSHRAGLVWLGTLLYLVYAYVVYAMAIHFNGLFLVYVAALGLSAYAAMLSVNGLRAANERHGHPAGRRLAGCTTIGIGVLFGLLWLSELIPAAMSGDVPPSVTDAGLWVNPIHVIDLSILLPGMIVAGYRSLKGDPAGEFFVGPLLVFSTLMGTSIVAAMVLMTAEGFEATLPPLVMVSVVVLASLFAAWRHLETDGSSAQAPTVTDPRGAQPAGCHEVHQTDVRRFSDLGPSVALNRQKHDERHSSTEQVER